MRHDDQLTEEARDAIASGIPDEELLTPMLNGKRVIMRSKDLPLMCRGAGEKGIIEDDLAKKRYRIVGRPCELPNCFCDLEAFEVGTDEPPISIGRE